MLDVTAIARCHRCNVISLPIHPNRSDPTHASVHIPLDWAGVRVFMDGEEDFLLCPECRDEAWEWLTTKVERRPSSDGACLVQFYPEDVRVGGWVFCELPKGHAGAHGLVQNAEECLARSWDGSGVGGDYCRLSKGHAGKHRGRGWERADRVERWAVLLESKSWDDVDELAEIIVNEIDRGE